MDVEGCPLPDDLLYDVESHVWVRPLEAARAEIGVIASFGSFAGKFVAVRFREIPDDVSEGQSLATLESHRLTAPFRSPFTGVVLARNPAVVATPKLLNNAPYTDGWLARLEARADRPALSLVSARVARDRIAAEVRELRIRCYAAVPDVELVEIGLECSAVLAKLDEEVARREPDEIVLLVTDDPTSPIEMARWEMRTGHTLLSTQQDENRYHFLVRREAQPVPRGRFAPGAGTAAPT